MKRLMMMTCYRQYLSVNWHLIIYSNTALLDGLEVGNVSLFALHCLLGILFHVIGVAAGLLLGNTHASRYGSLSALGILMLIISLSIEDNPNLQPKLRAVISPILFIGGYVLFMASLFLYQRVQDRAKEIYRSNYSVQRN
jgi:hypothetical protein